MQTFVTPSSLSSPFHVLERFRSLCVNPSIAYVLAAFEPRLSSEMAVFVGLLGRRGMLYASETACESFAEEALVAVELAPAVGVHSGWRDLVVGVEKRDEGGLVTGITEGNCRVETNKERRWGGRVCLVFTDDRYEPLNWKRIRRRARRGLGKGWMTW